MLKYKFTAHYEADKYVQNDEDRSLTNDEKSCFFDIKHDELLRFELEGDGHKYSVDLTDGHFEIDGIPFKLHELPLKDFRVIFFRRHTHGFNAMNVEIEHDTVYRMGWQTTYNGKNYQEVIEIK